jgi:hypothetical protein
VKTFYTKEQLLRFSLEDFKKKILDKTFICELKNKSFNCTPNNVLTAQPDGLPFSMTVLIDGIQNDDEILLHDIERLTQID